MPCRTPDPSVTARTTTTASAAPAPQLELETIDLSNNHLSAESALHIASRLADQPGLRSLNMGANGIEGEAKAAIQGKFKRRGSLFSLHIGY